MSCRICAILAVVWMGIVCTSPAFGAAQKPNLLLITVDDMNADSVGVFGSAVPDTTPNIDKLAREGIRFEHAHVQVANCMPSRNVMWSGRYPQNNRVEGFFPVNNPGYLTLADYAKQAGYFTAIYHKVRDSTPYSPYEWDAAFDTVPGTVGALPAKDAKSYRLSTAETIRRAKSAGKPFCLLINIADPHLPFYGLNRKGKEINDPFVPTRIYKEKDVSVPGFLPDDPIVRLELAQYYSSVRRADDAVGEVLHSLKESGEEDNTIVMFLSDHGMPFPFVKTQLYHWSTRTPLIFRWPGVIKANSVDSKHVVSAVDLLPTLLDGIGEEVPEGMDGRTFLPLLKGETQDQRDTVFKVYSENAAGGREPMRAIESTQFLYIFNPWSNGKRAMFSATNDTKTYQRMSQLAQDDPKMAARMEVLKHRTLEEFYDIQKDPDCLVNLISDPAYQTEIERYRGMLEQQLRKLHDPMLATFVDRDDPAVLDAYMRGQQELIEERQKWIRAIQAKMQKSG